MKKLIILSALIFVFAGVVSAQKGKEKQQPPKRETPAQREQRDNDEKKEWQSHDVNDQAKQHFDNDFKNTSEPKWERTSRFDEVHFSKDGKNSKAYYGNNSVLVGTTNDVTYADLPMRAQRSIKRTYRSYHPTNVQLYKGNKNNRRDMTLYNKSFTGSGGYFVEMENDNKRIVLRVTLDGDVSFFSQTN